MDRGCAARLPHSRFSSSMLLALALLAESASAGSVAQEPGIHLGAVTIDSMRTGTSTGSTDSYTPATGLITIGRGTRFYLSDGTAHFPGAGFVPRYYSVLDHVEVAGDNYRYFLRPPADSVIYYQISYGSDLTLQGTLVTAAPMVVVANRGSNIATIQGLARIRDNVSIGSFFRYFSADPGRVVPFVTTLVNVSRPWTPGAFDSSFVYQASTLVDFTRPQPPSGLLSLEVRGPLHVGAGSETKYAAIARYSGSLLLDVTSAASWSVAGPAGVGVSAGLLGIGAVTGGSATITLGASFGPAGGSVQATRQVRAHADLAPIAADQWPMFQADAAHSGYRPVTLHPELFALRWVKAVAPIALNPVTAADGKVFCSANIYGGNPGPSLFAFSAESGALLWSKDFGPGAAFTVNPPAFLDDQVYVQTVNRDRDTWLWALRASDGTVNFRVPHQGQLDHHLAPAFFGQKVYVNADGGMYAFDGHTGATQWFAGPGSLPNYNEWTPAVDSSFAYAYLGFNQPGLYAVHRESGGVAYLIPDPDFGGSISTTNLAPVLGPMQDAFVVNYNNHRLLCFDLVARSIKWSVVGGFRGQPSVANGVVYAIESGRLRAYHEPSGASLWGWQPASGALEGALIVTDSHVLCSTANTTFAISLDRRVAVWSHPSGGTLALANGSLYIATRFGSLSSIHLSALPTATTLQRFEVVGRENSVEVRWRFSDPGEVARTTVERSATREGPWIPLEREATLAGADWLLVDEGLAGRAPYWYRLSALMRDGSRAMFGPITASTHDAVVTTGLVSLGPSPVSGELRLAWSLARPARVRIRLLDVQGREAADFVDDALGAGAHARTVAIPRSVASGLYFVRMEAAGSVTMRKLAVTR